MQDGTNFFEQITSKGEVLLVIQTGKGQLYFVEMKVKESFKRQYTKYSIIKFNQSRMCGKRVRLGPFPSDSLESQSYDFDEIAYTKPLYGVERLHENSFKS